MVKKGSLVSSPLGYLALMVIVVVVIFLVVIPRINLGGKTFLSLLPFGKNSDDSQKTESAAEIAFSSFITSYDNCMLSASDNCLCDQFDASNLPSGYSMRLENLATLKARIEIYSGKPTPEKIVVKDFNNFCLYKYDKSSGKFSKEDAKEISFENGGNYDYMVNNKIQIFRIDRETICLVSGTYESKDFDEATRLYQKCSLKEQAIEQKSGILDISDYSGDYQKYPDVLSNPTIKNEESSAIIEQLSNLLLENVGKVTRITEDLSSRQTRIERRTNMFREAYNNFDADKDGNKDGKISDNIYVVSIRSVQIKKEDSKITKDYFKIHYLKDSPKSKELAQKIGIKLQEANSKLISNDQELKTAEADERYRFDFQIIYEENSKENVGTVFLACMGDYSDFIACKENVLIPAVFIDVVEVNGDGHYMFEGHKKTIARKIYEGVKDYLGK